MTLTYFSVQSEMTFKTIFKSEILDTASSHIAEWILAFIAYFYRWEHNGNNRTRFVEFYVLKMLKKKFDDFTIFHQMFTYK